MTDIDDYYAKRKALKEYFTHTPAYMLTFEGRNCVDTYKIYKLTREEQERFDTPYVVVEFYPDYYHNGHYYEGNVIISPQTLDNVMQLHDQHKEHWNFVLSN